MQHKTQDNTAQFYCSLKLHAIDSVQSMVTHIAGIRYTAINATVLLMLSMRETAFHITMTIFVPCALGSHAAHEETHED